MKFPGFPDREVCPIAEEFSRNRAFSCLIIRWKLVARFEASRGGNKEDIFGQLISRDKATSVPKRSDFALSRFVWTALGGNFGSSTQRKGKKATESFDSHLRNGKSDTTSNFQIVISPAPLCPNSDPLFEMKRRKSKTEKNWISSECKVH